MNIQWDAKQYTQNFSFVHQYGRGLIELIENPGGAEVLDLGCGTGDLTRQLKEEGMKVIGMDASREQLEIAKATHPEISFVHGDATEFSLVAPVDVVFSNAVLHWIDGDKHPGMLNKVHEALKPAGQFIFEFGGSGNNHLIHQALRKGFEKRGYAYVFPFYFPSIGEYTPKLESAGFKVVYAHLFDRMTELEGEDGLYNWIKMFIKAPFQEIPESDEEAIISEALLELRAKLHINGKWHADYVRIRCKAIKNL
ncbi:MAG: methyltransferase type 11 [delta proteobacterium ML8_F1]|nr:MAG: methyltransferase type 11 [delta proteobacterium ML8_F1]